MTLETSLALNSALRRESDLAGYTDRVQVVTDCKAGAITSTCEVYGLTMVQFGDFYVFIDLCTQPTAFKIKLRTAYKCQQQLDKLSADIHNFTHAYIQGSDRARLLVDCSTYDTKPEKELFAGLTPFYHLAEPVSNELMDDIWTALGMLERELIRITHVVLDFWKGAMVK